MSSRALPAVPFLLLSSCLLANAVHAAGQGDGSVIELGEQTVVATAQEETKQRRGFPSSQPRTSPSDRRATTCRRSSGPCRGST